MLKEAKMANGFWPQAHLYTNHTCNCSSTRAFEHTTPYEVFYSRKPNVSTLYESLDPTVMSVSTNQNAKNLTPIQSRGCSVDLSPNTKHTTSGSHPITNLSSLVTWLYMRNYLSMTTILLSPPSKVRVITSENITSHEGATETPMDIPTESQVITPEPTAPDLTLSPAPIPTPTSPPK